MYNSFVFHSFCSRCCRTSIKMSSSDTSSLPCAPLRAGNRDHCIVLSVLPHIFLFLGSYFLVCLYIFCAWQQKVRNLLVFSGITEFCQGK